MKNPDSHLWLYAKHHYVQNKMMDDLKIIVGERCGIDPESVGDGDVCSVLLGLVVPRLKLKSDGAVAEFLLALRPDEAWKYARKWEGVEPTYHEMLAAKCLSLLSLETVRTKEGVVLIELDPPDPLLLGIAYHG